MTTDDEELKILERAQWLYELGIPGCVVGASVTVLSGFFQDVVMGLIGTAIFLASFAFIELGRRYKEKYLP